MKSPETLATLTEWLGSGSLNIFGRPFAGKDTQGRVLASLFHGTLLGGGDILRGSTISEDIKAHMRAGHLIPSEQYVNIVLPYLMHESLASRPLILSSVGRWHGEEEGVIHATEQAGHPLRAVIYLHLGEAAVQARWQALEHHDDRGGRHDDTLDVLETRLQEFSDKTVPVIDYYREKGLVVDVEADGSPETITEHILAQLIQHTSL